MEHGEGLGRQVLGGVEIDLGHVDWRCLNDGGRSDVGLGDQRSHNRLDGRVDLRSDVGRRVGDLLD